MGVRPICAAYPFRRPHERAAPVSEPSICPACQSERVRIIGSERLPQEFIYRRKACRVCGHRYSTAGRKFLTTEGVVVTLEAPGSGRRDSRLHLQRLWRRLSLLMSITPNS